MQTLSSSCGIKPCYKSSQCVVLTRKKIYKSLAGLSFSFCLLFTAFECLEMMQSSLNAGGNKGVIGLSLLYATFVFSCLVVSQPVLTHFGCKVSMAVSMWGYILWIAANAYTAWPIMILCSVMVGLAAGPLWAAQKTYIILLSRKYADFAGDQWQNVSAKFFGIVSSVLLLRESSPLLSHVVQPRITQVFLLQVKSVL